jgi:hypothetical protein
MSPVAGVPLETTDRDARWLRASKLWKTCPPVPSK